MTDQDRKNELEERCKRNVLTALNGFPFIALKLANIRAAEPAVFSVFSDDEIGTALKDLAERGHVERVRKEIEPSVKYWKITVKGRDFIKEEGMG